MEPQSTAILNIALAADRSAKTWTAHVDDLRAHHFIPLGLASDRGRGVVAGSHSACEDAPWVCDQCHALQDLCDVLAQWARKAYAAIAKEEAAAQTCCWATSEANLYKRLEPYVAAHHACAQAITLSDQLALLLDLLRDAFHLCSASGKLRTPQGVRAALTRLLPMIEDLACAALSTAIKPIRDHLDDIVVPFEPAHVIHAQLRDAVPQHAVEFLMAAWHHEHRSSQAHAKQKRSHHRQRHAWLDVAAGLLAHDCATLKRLVFANLDAVVRASSLVAMVNSLMRPSLNTCTGHITQETFNLIMFDHNHRRDKSGTRKGQAPLEILTGTPFPGQGYARFIQQGNTQAGGQANDARRPPAPLQRVVYNKDEAILPATSLAQVSLDNTADADHLVDALPAHAAA